MVYKKVNFVKIHKMFKVHYFALCCRYMCLVNNEQATVKMCARKFVGVCAVCLLLLSRFNQNGTVELVKVHRFKFYSHVFSSSGVVMCSQMDRHVEANQCVCALFHCQRLHNTREIFVFRAIKHS